MSTEYYCRYCNGEYVAVWNELVLAQRGVRIEPLYSQSRQIAQEIVNRSFANLSYLHNTLIRLGYKFARPGNALREASVEDKRHLEWLEGQYGPLPVIMRAWYERIGCVDFRQHDAQLLGREQSDVAGLGCNCVLVFLSIAECLELQAEFFGNESEPQGIPRGNSQSLFPLGSIASNNDAKGFWLPDESFDVAIYNDGAGDIYFVQEVRMAMEWGGFPFWKVLLRKKKFSTPIGCVPEFRRLLPVLTKDLVQM